MKFWKSTSKTKKDQSLDIVNNLLFPSQPSFDTQNPSVYLFRTEEYTNIPTPNITPILTPLQSRSNSPTLDLKPNLFSINERDNFSSEGGEESSVLSSSDDAEK